MSNNIQNCPPASAILTPGRGKGYFVMCSLDRRHPRRVQLFFAYRIAQISAPPTSDATTAAKAKTNQTRPEQGERNWFGNGTHVDCVVGYSDTAKGDDIFHRFGIR